jgi:hypothetical protein
VNGNPVISYLDSSNVDLRVVVCIDPICSTSVTPVIVDSTGNTGFDSSIAIGVNGFPVISYLDNTSGDLRVAACNDATCSTSTRTTVDSAGDTGFFSSIAIGVNGNPVISYYDYSNTGLRVAACNDAMCSFPATLTTVDSAGNTGWESSLAIGVNGFPVVSYFDNSNGDLRVANLWWMAGGR